MLGRLRDTHPSCRAGAALAPLLRQQCSCNCVRSGQLSGRQNAVDALALDVTRARSDAHGITRRCLAVVRHGHDVGALHDEPTEAAARTVSPDATAKRTVRRTRTAWPLWRDSGIRFACLQLTVSPSPYRRCRSIRCKQTAHKKEFERRDRRQCRV
jgi:hypothetical protein